MASVMVFVDDAVRGSLPRICSRDGVPTTSSLRRRDEVGDRAGLGVAWLLLLAGPIGWLGLLVIALSKSGRVEELTVELPLGDAAYGRLRTARRRRDRSVFALVAGMVIGFLLLIATRTTLIQFGLLVAGVVVAVGFVTLIANTIRLDRETLGVSLDASRRWVSLSNVHPQFVAACQAHEASQPRRT
jgi:hypothetical protein